MDECGRGTGSDAGCETDDGLGKERAGTGFVVLGKVGGNAWVIYVAIDERDNVIEDEM